VSEDPERQSAAAAAAEHVRAIVEAAERETEAQLAQLQRAADGLAARADDIEQQLERLTQGVRSAIHALREDLHQLRAVSPAELPAPAAPAAPEPVAAPEPAAATPAARAPQPAATPPGAEGARVIALNMALGGSSRDETASYLSENFELDDPDALLDEVYARVGGSQ
jgi:hypothetical protein